MRVACKQKPAKSPPQALLTLKLQLPTHSKWQSLAREKSLTLAIRRQSRNILPGPVPFGIATKNTIPFSPAGKKIVERFCEAAPPYRRLTQTPYNQCPPLLIFTR